MSVKLPLSQENSEHHLPFERVTVGEDDGISPVGILLHGFGANAESISDLAHYFLPAVPYWVVPQAPIDLSEFFESRAYAWFPAQQQQIAEALTGSLWNSLENENFEELALVAQKIIDECILSVRKKTPSRAIALVGYSQGGMVASEVLLQCLAHDIAIDTAVFFSTCMVARKRWEDLAQKYIVEKKSRVTPPDIVQFHGTLDTVLTLEHAHRMKEFWAQHAQLQFFQFDGGHELPVEVLEHTKNFLLQKFFTQEQNK